MSDDFFPQKTVLFCHLNRATYTVVGRASLPVQVSARSTALRRESGADHTAAITSTMGEGGGNPNQAEPEGQGTLKKQVPKVKE